MTLDLWRGMDINKSAIHPNYPEERNPSFTLIYSILLSGYVLAGCSIVKRKATNRTQTVGNYAQWHIGRWKSRAGRNDAKHVRTNSKWFSQKNWLISLRDWSKFLVKQLRWKLKISETISCTLLNNYRGLGGASCLCIHCGCFRLHKP